MKNPRFENTLKFAKRMDQRDPLKKFRSKFHIPQKAGKPVIYFAGNSLGLQPKSSSALINEELKDWKSLGVDAHFDAGRPWLHYHKLMKKGLANVVGAKSSEVVAMNQLTVNLHLMMVSFYQPTSQRFKILTEAGAFSSDQYAFESQIKFHGLDPENALIELKPRDGEFTLRTEDILQAIRTHGGQLALVIFGGVQYYTGQFFDLKAITEAGHKVGAHVGFDLAHAVGNVTLTLHKDNVDFAAWCSYKYLNSGPGGVAGIFIHERFANDKTLPRFAGWWGHDEKERFQMKKGFKPIVGAEGWQLSNFPVLSGATHLASLMIFQEVGMTALRKKSELLTGYLEFLLKEADPGGKYFHIITPADPKQRGCQLSIFFNKDGKKIFNKIIKTGVVADWREASLNGGEAGVIRVAPVPLYNSFEEVFRFSELLKKTVKSISATKK